MTSKSDPLELGGLDPATIAKAIDEKKSKVKVPTELEQKKEARLAQKEARLHLIGRLQHCLVVQQMVRVFHGADNSAERRPARDTC